MKIAICPNCGNTKRFREWVLIHRTNFFVQDANGRIIKESCEEKQDQEHDSRVFCNVCDKEIEDEYHQFLDNYSESLFTDNKMTA
ncbi:MAG: hypothetical protein J7K02_00430 [Deltaproteobacteria bacterium]|nr:hypothetical protein [Deltaproteobacteria bacterium]